MKLIYIGFLALGFAGCASSSRLATEDSRGNRNASDPARVQVFAGKDIGAKYQILGGVMAVADGQSGEKALAELRREASLLGANAVVDLRVEIERGFWDAAVKATGLAVVKEAP
ncbi:MAG: hypothetical protein EOP11_17915 [Proteobacteria bacterium]|nr:MAG: hypothetical protein EOP11_17915 [Pseudomonadota bacterium]